MKPLSAKPYSDPARPELKYVVHVPSEARVAAGKKAARFKTKQEADDWIYWLNNELAFARAGIRQMSGDMRSDAFRAFDILTRKLGPGHTLTDAANALVEKIAQGKRAMEFGSVADQYVASLRALGRSDIHVATADKKLKRARESFGARDVCAITTSEVSAWLAEQTTWSPSTRNGVRMYVGQVFEYARRELKLIQENPVVDVRTATVEGKPVETLTVEQFRRLLKAARDMDNDALLLWFAIGGLAGLRPCEVEALEWANVHDDETDEAGEPEIEVDAKNPRSYSHRYVTITPALKAWFARFPEREGRVVNATPVQLRRARYEAMHRAGLAEWPTDCLRHSYGSYHLAAFGDLKDLMRLMGHSSSKMIEKHYRRRMKKTVALPWWDSTPLATNFLILPEPTEAQKTEWGRYIPAADEPEIDAA